MLFEDGRYAEDMGLLWASYKRGGFPALPKTFDEHIFTDVILNHAKDYDSLWIIEDDSKVFKSGRGPVAFVGVKLRDGGWAMEPHVEWFAWASPRAILRGSVAFFQMVRYSKDVGVCVVRSLKKHANLFYRLKDYGVLFYCGKIPKGDFRGDEYIFSVNGKKNGHEVAKMIEIEATV